MAAAAVAQQTERHGHTGAPCASCTNTQTCDCPCNVCVLARRRVAGHICLKCDEICGSTECEYCAAGPCTDCGRWSCDGFVCPAADHDDSDDPCYDCKQIGCDGGMWCPANNRDDCSTDSEMEEMMQEQREEEDRRFRVQMARHRAATAAAKPAGTTFTITLTGASLTGAGLMAAAAAGGGSK